MTFPKSLAHAFALCLFLSACTAEIAEVELIGVNTAPEFTWGAEIPEVKIPAPPTDAGLANPALLRAHDAIFIDGDQGLQALAATENGPISGAGTEDDPYVIENLLFTEYATGKSNRSAQLLIERTTKPLVIRNCEFRGRKRTEFRPDNRIGLAVISGRNVTVKNCLSYWHLGFRAENASHVTFERARVYSGTYGIFASESRHIAAYRCYVNDTCEIGIYLYNGPDNRIEECYVHNTGREGIGTHGTAPRHVYKNNVVYNTGWNVVNMEGAVSDYIISGNILGNSHYGVTAGGNFKGGPNGIIADNVIFNCTQNGIITTANYTMITGNTIVRPGQDGIWLYNSATGCTVAGNRIYGGMNAIKADGKANEGRQTIKDNFFANNFAGVVFTGNGSQDSVIVGNTFTGVRNAIIVRNFPGIVIDGNTFVHALHGLRGYDAAKFTVANNVFRFVGIPIELRNCRDSIVEGNTSTMSYYGGVMLADCSGIRVVKNRIRGSRSTLIRIDGGENNVIAENDLISGGGHTAWTETAGIYFKKTKNNTIENNDMLDGYIRFREACVGNVIKNNRIDNFGDNIFEIPEATYSKNTFDIADKIRVIKNSERKSALLEPLE